jgi:hypothetical protein
MSRRWHRFSVLFFCSDAGEIWLLASQWYQGL